MKTTSTDSEKVIRILHLSDFHFDHEKQWDQVLLLRDLPPAIGQFVQQGLAPDFVAITGDVANKGRKQDYETAEKWITERLLPVLPEPFNRKQILIVPGNHDIDRSVSRIAATSTLTVLLAKHCPDDERQDDIAKVLGDPDEQVFLLRRHQEYLKFANSFGPAARGTDVPWPGLFTNSMISSVAQPRSVA